MKRRSGDRPYTRENARFQFILAVRRLRPACLSALGKVTGAPPGELESGVARWAQDWGVAADWCARWALRACLENRELGEIVCLPLPAAALSLGPRAERNSVGVDGCPGLLRWLQRQELTDLAEWFDDPDVYELAGVETGGAPQRKAKTRERLVGGCAKLVSKYLQAVEAHYAPLAFPEAAFEWLVRRAVPREARGAVETWQEIAPGNGEGDDLDDPVDESTSRRVASALAEFLPLRLPNRTDSR